MGLIVGSGDSLDLGREVAAGGQGVVFEVLAPKGLVFKRVSGFGGRSRPSEPTPIELSRCQARVDAMVATPPLGVREDRSGHPMLAWPADSVYDSGSFVGFVMPAINTASAVELHQIANPSDRTAGDPSHPWVRGFSWKYLVRVAANLALAVDRLHTCGVVVGDFNERNILVHSDARVTLLDCDSMQVQDSSGQWHLCPVGRPEFTAPELLHTDWLTTVRYTTSDLFALAVHIHQLLMQGNRPFDGVWAGAGEKPKAPQLARDGMWAYRGDRQLSPRPSAPPAAILSDSISNLFALAFVDGATNPRLRPSALEWHGALTQLETALITCQSDGTHVYRNQLSACPWCASRTTSPQHQQPLPIPKTPPAGGPPPFTGQAPPTRPPAGKPPPFTIPTLPASPPPGAIRSMSGAEREQWFRATQSGGAQTAYQTPRAVQQPPPPTVQTPAFRPPAGKPPPFTIPTLPASPPPGAIRSMSGAEREQWFRATQLGGAQTAPRNQSTSTPPRVIPNVSAAELQHRLRAQRLRSKQVGGAQTAPQTQPTSTPPSVIRSMSAAERAQRIRSKQLGGAQTAPQTQPTPPRVIPNVSAAELQERLRSKQVGGTQASRTAPPKTAKSRKQRSVGRQAGRELWPTIVKLAVTAAVFSWFVTFGPTGPDLGPSGATALSGYSAGGAFGVLLAASSIGMVMVFLAGVIQLRRGATSVQLGKSLTWGTILGLGIVIRYVAVFDGELPSIVPFVAFPIVVGTMAFLKGCLLRP